MSATLTPSPAPRTGRESLFSPAYRALTIGAVALVALFAFEALAVGTAMPTVAAALDGIPLYAIAFAAPFAAGVLGFVASGIWCDARGPAHPILYGVGWFVTGLVIAGTAPVMEFVVAGRAIQGFGSGMLSVALYVLVAKAYPEALHPRIFAAFAAAWVVPALVGPALAGLIVAYVGWRWVFLLVPLLAVPAVLLVLPALRRAGAPVRERVPADARARIGWAAGAAVGAALLHYGGQQRGALAVVGVTVALVSLLVCVPRLMPPGFLRAARGLPTVIVLRGLAGAAFFGAEAFIPLLLTHERGFEPAQAGLALTVGAVFWSIGSWLQGRMRPPRSRATLPRAGLLLVAVGGMLVAAVLLPWMPVAVMMAGWGLAALGMGLTYPGLSVLTLELSAPDEKGRNSSSLQLSESIFNAVVLAFGGALLAGAAAPARSTFLAGFGLAVLLALLGAALAGRVVPRTG